MRPEPSSLFVRKENLRVVRSARSCTARCGTGDRCPACRAATLASTAIELECCDQGDFRDQCGGFSGDVICRSVDSRQSFGPGPCALGSEFWALYPGRAMVAVADLCVCSREPAAYCF